MKLSNDTYIPSLRWRQAEYQALLCLSDAAKARTVPLITIPPIEYDFEEEKLKKDAEEHVKPFPKRYKEKWGIRPAWIDVDPSLHGPTMANGQDVFSFVFAALRKFGAAAVPVITVDAPDTMITIIAAIVATDGKGVAIRARFEDIMRPTFTQAVRALLEKLKVKLADADLIIDLGAPNYEPYDDFSKAMSITLSAVTDLAAFRNFVLVGTAIPPSMADISKDGGDLKRHDWLFYQLLMSKLPPGVRHPNYGDYTIVHPAFVVMDMRKRKPAGKVVYATGKTWHVEKGGAFLEDREQMHDHCDEIANAAYFKGAGFSWGDDYIAKCAVRAASPSNQTQWKKVAINHHIMQVLDDLSKFAAAA